MCLFIHKLHTVFFSVAVGSHARGLFEDTDKVAGIGEAKLSGKLSNLNLAGGRKALAGGVHLELIHIVYVADADFSVEESGKIADAQTAYVRHLPQHRHFIGIIVDIVQGRLKAEAVLF